ncbi:XapX domain-containing protein [Undibacterium sp. Jales W-56]|uniref:XapX domain-containing protein n=1 Tax=Undibacterium sp. Jales W-56 TaxID=2897325 RepID=UPI0021CED543|nr:XapX domain-containing protein [Undibacterium sp. Jales W-56]MCU6432764.1 XapX domain-containing protein [Undibacterium sp. Jales W-56]
MKIYLVAVSTGILVGVIYALLNVKSPAPPIVALLGLLGMLVGEQVVPFAKRLLHKEPISAAWLHQECLPKITGVTSATETLASDDQVQWKSDKLS